MRTLYALPTMTTSLASWRPSNALANVPCSPVVQRLGFSGVRKCCNHASRRQYTTSRTVVRARGDFFTSEVVRREFERLNEDLATMAPMMDKFPDFDLEGKRIFMQQADAFAERFEIYATRMRLTEDPLAKDMVQRLNVQLREASVSLEIMVKGIKVRTELMRKLLEEEERTADPAKVQALREAFRAFAPGPRPVLSAKDLTPDEMQGALDPQAIAAMTKVAADPLALEKYRDNPRLYSLLKKLDGKRL